MHIRTASNSPTVTNIEDAATILDSWNVVNPEQMTFEVNQEGFLDIRGRRLFEPYRKSHSNEVNDVSTIIDTDGFLESIADVLETPLIIQQISHENGRFPLNAEVITVEPSTGDIERGDLGDIEKEHLGEIHPAENTPHNQ